MNDNITMSVQEYAQYVKQMSPKSKTVPNMLKAFVVGGVICAVGQVVLELWQGAVSDTTLAAGLTSVTMIAVGVLLTALNVYDNLAAFGRAGTLVPITGFANSVASPAIEFHAEGLIAGMSSKMFAIAGPVLVFGLSASVVYGIVYYFIPFLG